MGLAALFKPTLGLQDRVDFFKTLSSWLSSGGGRMSLSESVANTCDAFSHDEYKALKPKMDAIKGEVYSGQSTLYQCLAVSDLGFSRQEVAIIEAAEKSSQLRQSLPALVQALDIQSKSRRELTFKLAGPLTIGVILIIMTLGVLLVMMPLIVGPTIQRNESALATFPWLMRAYWYVSVWLSANLWFLFTLFGTPIILFVLRQTPLMRQSYQTFIMRWKVTRRLILSYNSVLVSYFMPALVRSGMPTYQVLEQLSECVSNPTLSAIIRHSSQLHEQGIRLSEALQGVPFRASFINAVKAGEATGSLAERISELQDNYLLDMERQMKVIVGTLKFVVMLILLPIFILSTYTALVAPIFALMEYK
ncbi:MAG: hypothetical protein COY40_04095 [Alphaproteobacteria bacterium CG_4_10_14_0_8_um_filter_53_9]|nr:MAG: hypothetical protein COY40_04095 [Alphaproteobacteria bacterium CG_4_10_14_0_8_um_filter_53_9]